ncbi:MAG: PAS domain-containing protein [Kiloniellales bacterium]|nr:PAS domain-containing protein [Kiloniellales bacterium]
MYWATTPALEVNQPEISDTKQAQLPDSRRFAETLLNNLPGMVYRCLNDRPWTMTFVSSGCEALTGHTPEFVLSTGLGWANLVHPDDRNAARLAVTDAVAAGKKFDIQYRIIDKFGVEKWVREQGCGVCSGSEPAGAIEGYIDDITPLRTAALTLANAQAFYEEELRKKAERLSVTIDSAPMGIVTFRFGEAFLSANRAFCEMTGYSVDELKEKTVEEITHPDHRRTISELSELVQQDRSATYSQRTRFVRKDGSAIDVSVVNAVTHDAEGQPSLIICQVADLTAQTRAQTEIRQLHAQLAHADRLHILGEMASGIAHEINQPLTAISLFAQAGRRLFESGEYENLQHVFEKLSQHAQRAGAIVERIQSMARRSEGARQIVDLSALVVDVVDLAEIDARMSDIFIELNLPAGQFNVEVDVVQIQQVMLNLLRNGIDAMRSISCRNGNTIQVSIHKRPDGLLEIAVKDNGGGVPDEIAEGLFEPFMSTKSLGLGMGLPISQEIVTAHGGQMTFRNHSGSGAVFSFTLPPAKSAPSPH